MTDRSPVRQAEALIEASPAAAMRVLGPYLTTEPDDWRALCLAAQAQVGLDDPARALDYARRASQLNPHSDWPVRLQTIAHRDLGHSYDAQQLSRQSVLINPANWQTHLLVANADLAARSVNHHSLAAARKSRELAPAEPETHIVVGQVALDLGLKKEAVQAFERALQMAPDNAVARHELARAQLRRGRVGRALDGFLATGRLDPTIRQVRANLHNIIARVIQLLHYVVLAGCLLSPFDGPLAGALVVLAWLAALAWAGKRGGRPLLRVLAGVPRADPMLFGWAVALLGSSALLVLRGVLTLGKPAGTSAASPLSGLAFLLLFVGAACTWLRRARPPRVGR